MPATSAVTIAATFVPLVSSTFAPAVGTPLGVQLPGTDQSPVAAFHVDWPARAGSGARIGPATADTAAKEIRAHRGRRSRRPRWAARPANRSRIICDPAAKTLAHHRT